MHNLYEQKYHLVYYLDGVRIHISKQMDHIGHTHESLEKRALHHAPDKFDYFKIEKRYYPVNQK